MRIALLLAAGLGFTSVAEAADIQANPGNYRDRLANLAPGDRLILASGVYMRGLPIEFLNGGPQTPIIIEGPADQSAVILGRACCNTIGIRDSSWVTIRNLTLDQQGEFVDGVKAEANASYAHHIVLEDISMFNFAAEQQAVGVSTKCPAWDWEIRRIEIRDVGTGMYLGDSDGTSAFVRGTIEYNLVINPIGYAMQIKHQNARELGNGMPTDDAVTHIRHNVFSKAAGASTGNSARPNLLVGAFPNSGPGSSDLYEIYGNFLHENASGTEGVFQGEGNVSFYNNVLVNSQGPGAFFQNNNGPPKDTRIFNNTIVVADEGVGLRGAAGGFTQLVEGNVIYSPSPYGGSASGDNVTGGLGASSATLIAAQAGLPGLDIHPLPGQLSGNPLDRNALRPFASAVDQDFDGRQRANNYGAYASGQGWPLALAFKMLSGPMPPVDGGMPDGGGMDLGGMDATPPNPDAGGMDAGGRDQGPPVDLGPRPDAGFDDRGIAITPDAGPRADAGQLADASTNKDDEGGCRSVKPSGGTLVFLGVGLALITRRRRRA